MTLEVKELSYSLDGRTAVVIDTNNKIHLFDSNDVMPLHLPDGKLGGVYVFDFGNIKELQ